MKRKISEALRVLGALQLSRAQQNERSALCLLALLDLIPRRPWTEARNPLMGTTPIIDWISKYYSKVYAPNTRETIRKQTLHQFCEAGFVRYNPDDPDRPVNSPHAAYQIEAAALEVFRRFGETGWSSQISHLVDLRNAGIQKSSPPPATTETELLGLRLSRGPHSELILSVLNRFRGRFAPNARILYVGDTAQKWAHFDAMELKVLGIELDTHGKVPDIILFDQQRGWLFLIEAVTSHGPIDVQRYAELRRLFASSSVGLVFVTAFPDRQTMRRYLGELAWETEVWVADSPQHLIHFNGQRFLGPYVTQE